MSIDKHILDAMVQGQNVDPDYWQQLLKAPNADQLWFDAIDRRRQIDRFTRLVCASPSIAGLLQSARRRMKDLTTATGQIFATMQTDHLSYSLSDPADSPRNFEVSWNVARIEELPSGTRLSFKAEKLQSWHFQSLDDEGWLRPEDTWEVVAEEGPVLLTFFDKDLSTLLLKEALQTDYNRAVLTIIPAS